MPPYNADECFLSRFEAKARGSVAIFTSQVGGMLVQLQAPPFLWIIDLIGTGLATVALRLPEGRTITARQLQIPAVSPDVAGENTANTVQEMLGAQFRPVPVSPGLMVYLDQVKRPG
ncbi:hypothetical protein ASD00_17390 [Ensifer sp. Root31]|nr:hypothetical protein ASD00_17390 [Ensifer sp. Root31]